MFIEPNFGGKPQEERTGWIEVICGCMFSGKTEELIRRLNRAIIAKQKVEIFKPEDLDEYIAKFSEVVPLDPAKFYVAKVPGTAKKVEPTQVEYRNDKGLPDNKTRATLNEQLNQGRQPAVVDSLRKIKKIKDHLTINQKFMFTKVLFYGDFDSFSRTVDEIDQLGDMNEAIHYLEKQSLSWDRDSKEFHEFMEMVEKRFA